MWLLENSQWHGTHMFPLVSTQLRSHVSIGQHSSLNWGHDPMCKWRALLTFPGFGGSRNSKMSRENQDVVYLFVLLFLLDATIFYSLYLCFAIFFLLLFLSCSSMLSWPCLMLPFGPPLPQMRFADWLLFDGRSPCCLKGCGIWWIVVASMADSKSAFLALTSTSATTLSWTSVVSEVDEHRLSLFLRFLECFESKG